MTTEWQEHGGAVSGSSQKVEYAWSEIPSGANHSRLVSITYPDGYVLTFNYASGINDDISRLSSLSDTGGTLEEYDYLGYGTVVRRGHPQPRVDMTYIGTPGAGGDQYAGLDEFGRVVDLLWVKTSGPTALEHIQHSYDLLGNRLTRDNLVNSAFDEVYAYDDLSQLVNFARGAHTQDWDYDALGNWDSITTNGGTPETRSHNAQNQITSISGATTPAFDANGNMTGDETGRGFVYDAWNRLVEVKSGSTVLMTYRYDGLNRRVSADDGTDVTDLYYSNQWQVLEERVNGNVYAHYVWSPVYVDAMVLRDRSVGGGTLNERLYVVQDANFNIVALVNTSGNVVERYAYTPFGVRTELDASYNVLSGSAYDFQHGFQGRPYDAISATYNFRNREYSPTLGRPIQVDMLRFSAGDLNFYRWVSNGPTNRLDPLGLDDKPITDVGEIQKIIFGKKLPPKPSPYFTVDEDADILRSNSGCIGFVSGVCLSQKEFIERFTDFLKKSPNIEDPFKVAFNAAVSPENLPGVKCFKTFKDAAAFKAPEGKTKIIFRKCGQWAGGKEPKGPEVPINSIEGVAGNKDDWDYAVFHGGMWTHVQNQLGEQTGYHGKDEPKNDETKWKNCMYCVYLKDAKKEK